MSQHWKSLLVVLVIIGAIVYFYRGDKGNMQTEGTAVTTEVTAEEPIAHAPIAVQEPVEAAPIAHTAQPEAKAAELVAEDATTNAAPATASNEAEATTTE